MSYDFTNRCPATEAQFIDIPWGNGLTSEALQSQVAELEASDLPRAIVKAKTFALICEKGQISPDRADIFQDKLNGGKIMHDQRKRWEKAVVDAYLKEESEANHGARKCGAYYGHGDYGHVSPNSKLLLEVGFRGLLERVERLAAREDLTKSQHVYYDSCKIVLNAMMTAAARLADAIRPYNTANAEALDQLAVGAPRNFYEAMQLIVLYFFLHEGVAGGRVRTLGRLDAMLYPFYKRDLERGTYTAEEMREMLRYFLLKFWSAKVPFDLPLCIGGADEDGNEVTNGFSYLFVEVYDSLNIYSPKIHVRVSDKTPTDFIKRVLSCIRSGNSSFVFINDRIAVKALTGVGITERDAWNYVPIGCYEPAVWGVELGCTGNGFVSIAKAVELVFTNGRDHQSGKTCGVETGTIGSYEEFIAAIKAQIVYMTQKATDYVCAIERHYDKIYPDPILSCQYDHSVEVGVDLYEGGAKYNSSSMYYYGIATATDAVCAVKELVFDQKQISFEELGTVLKNNWSGHEELRQRVLHLSQKYGNGNSAADAVAKELADHCAFVCNNRPNGRGGVFKASIFTIDNCFLYGQKTMATPDGRYAGEPLSKNMSATAGMDKNGVTALIGSATVIDHSKFPNGSVLDVMLHPSAVAGDVGLDAFYVLLQTYFASGGFAMHGNVFNVNDLRAAQKDPQKYRTLQVRVCGWNAYFVDLSKIEQDTFIKQAEIAAST